MKHIVVLLFRFTIKTSFSTIILSILFILILTLILTIQQIRILKRRRLLRNHIYIK
jgi:uncharacterized membrane protein